jgi:hypothetical protein
VPSRAPSRRRTADRSLELASGRTVVIEQGADERVVVHDPAGRFEVGIRFTAAGPVLEVLAIGLHLRADATLTIDCDRLRLHGRSGVTIDSGGDLVERVAGDRRSEIGGCGQTTAGSVQIEAVEGDVDVHAINDARLSGRRVLLNP